VKKAAARSDALPHAARRRPNVIREPYTAEDFAHSPLLTFYETTQACDLACRHCRASARPWRHPEELNTDETCRLIDQLTTFPKPPLLVLTGGDPLKRPDLFDIIAYARQRGLGVAVTPSATPLVTSDTIARFKELGVRRLAVSLDGATAAVHDAFRGFRGSYDRTLGMMADARAVDLSLQVNTSVTRHNVHELPQLVELLATQGIVLWSVFFLVPTGRGKVKQSIPPHEYEEVFALLHRHSTRHGFGIKTTEAPHYRRYVLQQRALAVNVEPLAPRDDDREMPALRRGMLGAQDGKGVMFVSHTGRIFPSGFLPMDCGRFPERSVVEVYQQHPTFRALREPDALKGKCGACDYRFICGGSRARAFAVTGDPLEAEPDCVYQPPAWQERVTCSA